MPQAGRCEGTPTALLRKDPRQDKEGDNAREYGKRLAMFTNP